MIIGTNFKLSSAKFLDDRQLCKDYATLIANAEGIIYPPGFEVFCEYENKYYQYVSDTNGGYIWEERKSGVSDGTSASIKDDTISEEYTWSSAHIDSMRIDLETLITQANDYVDEIDERMLFIEGKFQWFEYFDGSYNSLTDKPIIPTKLSELENDSEFLGVERLELELENINEKIDTKIDKEEDRTLIPITELERLSTLGNYNDTEVRQLIDELETQAHTHINSDILNTITEEKINQWDNNTGVDDYNYIQNKPITRVGDDSDILLNFGQIIDEGMYIITAMVGEYKIHNELVHVKWADDDNVTLTIPNMFMVLNVSKTDGVWTIVNELHYGVDKENGKISDTLTIGEDKIILDKEGNGWFGGKVSQEGIPTEDKDLVTKGYVDNKFATNERVSAIEKENARRDVIIEALANGRRRTVETDGNDVDLMFSTEKDKVWIDKIEGETLVNVCDQEEPVAITKSYTVEGTNHVPLQGEYDGKARPVVHGNTLVNHNVEYDKSVIIGEKIDNIQGTEILNFEGTPNCEIKVDIDGHTAINLSTKKEDVLCKSFDSASGNEINLVAEENSVSDLVIQGNTMVNLCNLDNVINTYGYVRNNEKLTATSTTDSTYHIYYIGGKELFKVSTTYTIIVDVYENTITDGTLRISNFSGYTDNQCDIFNVEGAGSNNITINNGEIGRFIFVKTTASDFSQTDVTLRTMFSNPNHIEGQKASYSIMIFEGDLTQTPELIPTEYIEGIQSTFEDKLIPYSIYNGDNLTSITETQYQLPLTVKSNTQYTVTTTANTTKYQYAVYSTDGLTEYLSYSTTTATQTFTCNTSNVLFKVRMNPSYSGDDYSFVLDEVKDKFMIVEGDWSGRLNLLTEEYFGKYRVDMSSHGKNLFDKNNINELQYMYLNNGNGLITTDPYESLYWIKIKPSTTYTISKMDSYRGRVAFSKELPNLSTEIRVVTGTEASPSYPISATSLSDENYLLINGYSLTHLGEGTANYGETITKEELLNSIQIEEGSTVTPYEPYYGSSKTVYLNSPLLNGDELLTKDGKLYHYHKMGMVVLDGSEDEGIISYSTVGNTARVYASGVKNCKSSSILGQQGFCDTLQFIAHHKNINNEYINSYILDKPHVYGSSDGIYVFIEISKLSTTDATGFKQWLSENPTTVVYELAEPWYEPIGAYGKIVLDGSGDENWFAFNEASKTISYAGIQIPNMKIGYTAKIICDKFETLSDGKNYDQTYTKEQCYPYHITSSPNVGIIYFHVFNSRLSSSTKEGWIQWLQQNPVTVIYELAEPQYTDEDMRFNIASTSTIEYQSSVPMANTQFLPYRNELPLLESSTQYRVTFDCDVEGLELMVSLGGTSQTITSALHNELSFITPSLQTDGKLTIDGYGIAKIDNVLITSGSMEYEYFEGLKSGFEERKLENLMRYSERTYQTIGRWNEINRSIIDIKPSIVYTLIYECNYRFDAKALPEDKILVQNCVGKGCCKFSTKLLNQHLRIVSLDFDQLYTYKMVLLEGDWTDNPPTYEEVIANPNKYKATIKIQNPNAPIFGKGGRL